MVWIRTKAWYFSASCHTLLANVQRKSLSRCRQGIKRARRCGIVDNTKEGGRQTKNLAQPIELHLLQFRRCLRCTPEHSIHINHAGKHFAHDTMASTGNTNISQETRSFPMSNPWQTY